MKYWINYYDKKDRYTGKEIEADTIEELINTCMFDRDVVEVIEVIEDSEGEDYINER